MKLTGQGHAWARQRMHFKFWSENLKGRDNLKDISVDEMTELKWFLKKQHTRLLIGFIWLRIGTSGGLLRAL